MPNQQISEHVTPDIFLSHHSDSSKFMSQLDNMHPVQGTDSSRNEFQRLPRCSSNSDVYKSSDQDAAQAYLYLLSRARPKAGPHLCPHCGKQFRAPFHLRTHIRVHTGEKPFQCGKCGKAFTQKVNMLFHMRSQHPQ